MVGRDLRAPRYGNSERANPAGCVTAASRFRLASRSVLPLSSLYDRSATGQSHLQPWASDLDGPNREDRPVIALRITFDHRVEIGK